VGSNPTPSARRLSKSFSRNDTPDELLAVADAADVALSAVQVSRLQATLDAITSASEQTRRAWLGFNIGLHAAI
jgi:hypothetical protein